MKVSAIIAEYNPFHNGHKYHIEETKRRTDDSFVMVIMSGNFVQRGEPAIIEKRERARAAILGGADLVVELPVQWATASAERFARGAVYIAHQAGIVDYLSFGCENDDFEHFRQIARVLSDNVYSRRIKENYDANIYSYAQARTAVVSEVLGTDCTELMMKPNNILAIEYIRALQSFRSGIEPIGISRISAEHDSSLAKGNMTSAMNIRNLIRTNKMYSNFLPEGTVSVFDEAHDKGIFPTRYSRLETAVLADLRRKQPSDFVGVPDIAEGIEYRILEAAKTSVYQMYWDYEEALNQIKPHRILAINRGERENQLEVAINVDVDGAVELLKKQYAINNKYHAEAVEDGLVRLLSPAVVREIRSDEADTADDHGIGIFSENLKNLLMTQPIKGTRVLGVDPGIRTGTKCAALDETGKYLGYFVINQVTHPEEAAAANKLATLYQKKIKAF